MDSQAVPPTGTEIVSAVMGCVVLNRNSCPWKPAQQDGKATVRAASVPAGAISAVCVVCAIVTVCPVIVPPVVV
jgi:hypothetical protein